MRYINIEGQVIPKHCIYGPRQAEGIVFDNYEWWRITDHLVKDQKEKELAAAFKAKEEAKKELSQDMTRDWSNTLASIKTQGRQKRLESKLREEQDKIDQYKAILKNQDEENKRYCVKMRKLMSQEQDAAKTINSAMLYALVLEERQKQIERKNQKRSEEAKKDEELVQKMEKDAEQFRREAEEQKLRERRQKMKQKQILDNQVEELKRRRQKDIDEFEASKQDIIRMRLEDEKIQYCNWMEKNSKKNLQQKLMKETDAQLELKKKIALEQEVEDEINQIYQNYDWLIKKERRCREEKIKNEQIEERVKTAEALGKKLMEANARQEAIIAAAIQEGKKTAEKADQENAERKRQAKISWLEGMKKEEERRARKKYELEQEKKWMLMQRYRSAEVNEEYRQAEKKRLKQVQQDLRKALDCQLKEKAASKAKELEEWLTPSAHEAQLKEELGRYCQEVEDFAKEHHLPDYPIRMALKKVKKINGLIDKKEQEQKQREEEANNECWKQKSRAMGSGCYCLKY